MTLKLWHVWAIKAIKPVLNLLSFYWCWNWFAAPIFGRELTIPSAIGIACLVNLYLYKEEARNPFDMTSPSVEQVTYLGNSFTASVTLLSIAFVAHLFG